MKLTQIRQAWWINVEHVTDVWIQGNEKDELRFRLSSDAAGEENVLRGREEIRAFCEATGFVFPSA